MKTLGIDLGTNSLGWSLIFTDGEPGTKSSGQILDIGTRIFSSADMAGRDAKTKASLAVARREARTQRRQRDRRIKRKNRLLDQLTEFGLMPVGDGERKQLIQDTGDRKGKDLSHSILALRVKALDEALKPYELGRVLFHLQQRRGFKSNRKVDSADNEAGKIAYGVARLDVEMHAANARTYGEFLHNRRLAGQSIRTRLRPVNEFSNDPELKGDGYQYYPDRAKLEDELTMILDKQSTFHKDILTLEKVSALKDTILFQRPLLPAKPGKCSYNPHEKRLPKAHPLFQEFRLLKEVNELSIIGEDQIKIKLTPDQRDILALKLRTAKSSSFTQLRKLLKLGSEFSFNKESENRKKLEGNLVYASLAHKDCFGPFWSERTIDEQWEIISRLRDEADPLILRQWLQQNTDLDGRNIDAVMKVQLPEGYGRLGYSALSNLLDALKNETDNDGKVITEAEAAIRVYGQTNSEDDRNREAVEFLPKYQQVLERHIPPGQGGEVPNEKDPSYDRIVGRITNPTVHIALNQLRRVINALIKKHGRPDRIAIELGRDLKLNEKQRAEVNKIIGKNTRAAEGYSKKLRELGVEDTGYYRLRLQLWEELNPDQPCARECIYSGEAISITQALSSETDIDHILPYSRTLDDSRANKVLCKAHANRVKRNRAPGEVIEWGDDYDLILARAKRLPKKKRFRFGKDAMELFSGEDGFAARQLTDMQYLSRMALSYLAALYPAEEADIDGVLRRHSHVRALPGKMTEMLRRKWGLNDILHDHNYSDTFKPKNRKDHRHHAIDAFVIACSSRSMIQAIANASGRVEAEGKEKILAGIPDPWPGFRTELREHILASIVSHKQDHGTISRKGYDIGRGQTAKQLHNDTAYGLTNTYDDKGKRLVVRRRLLDDFKSEKDLMNIRDETLRDTLWTVTRDLQGDAFREALINFSAAKIYDGKPNPYYGIRHIRALESLNVIEIKDKDGKSFKGYKGDSNYRYDVWLLPNGKWKTEVLTTFDAHQPEWTSDIRSQFATAKKVLSLQQNDMIAVEQDGEKLICRVVKFASAGAITLAQNHEAGALKSRDSDNNDPFKYLNMSASSLQKSKARQVRVDELGQVFDPGPRSSPH